MAVYHLKMSVGSRDGGQSARAKDAYIEREDRYAKQDPEECEHVEHGHMPAWAQDDQRTYWGRCCMNTLWGWGVGRLWP